MQRIADGAGDKNFRLTDGRGQVFAERQLCRDRRRVSASGAMGGSALHERCGKLHGPTRPEQDINGDFPPEVASLDQERHAIALCEFT